MAKGTEIRVDLEFFKESVQRWRGRDLPGAIKILQAEAAARKAPKRRKK